MSKNRNRPFKLHHNVLVINNVQQDHSQRIPSPILPPQQQLTFYGKNENIFGEFVANSSQKNNIQLSNNNSIDSVFSINNSETSSATSINSWGVEDEYKLNGTRVVQDELERMDRIFAKIEPIPTHYDQEEYKEWMTFFPNLRILSNGNGLVSDNDDDDYEEEEETIIEGCDTIKSKKSPKNEINIIRPDSKIDNDLKFKRKLGQIQVQINDLNLDLDDYLKISPLKNYFSFKEEKEAKIKQRQKSSKLLNSDRASSKWMKDDKFNVLPQFINNNDNRKSATIRTKRKSNLILPPIEGTQFRSVSATPRKLRQNKDNLDSIRNSGRLLRWNIVEE